MNQLYRSIGISKQAFHQHMDRYLLLMDEQHQMVPLIEQIRADHPRLSARQIYFMLQPQFSGRDRFEQFCFAQGYKIARKRSFRRTTDSRGVTRFDNLLIEFELTGINQVYVSDITFYEIGDRFYFLTFILDLKSRFIVGHCASENLLTEHTTIPALRMALKKRNITPGLIFHSDGGGQYYSKQFLAITKQHSIRNSMCESVYENPNAERINGTIKNDYLVFYNPKTFDELKIMLNRAVDMYNNQRPHSSLKRQSPAAYESLLTESSVVHKRKKEPKKEKDNNHNNKFTSSLKTVNAIQA
jgi:transposase InsO family protein